MWKVFREVGRKLSVPEIKMENKELHRKLQRTQHVITVLAHMDFPAF